MVDRAPALCDLDAGLRMGQVWGHEQHWSIRRPSVSHGVGIHHHPYPGASAQEVEQEVTDVVETALQELPYLQQMRSKSVPGRSEIQIEIDERLDPNKIPQVWDEMRRRVNEARAYLPSGAMEPLVEDDFGDVYGIYYAVTADGFSQTDS